MRFAGLIAPALRLFGPRSRRVWTTETRAHVEFRPGAPDEMRQLAAALEHLASAVAEVRWVQVNGYTRRVTVECEPGSLGAEQVEELVEAAERLAHLDGSPFDDRSAELAADLEPALRLLLGLLIDLGALGAGVLLRLSPIMAVPFTGNLSALVSVLRGAPKLREGIEVRLGKHRTDLLLALTSAVLTAAAQRPLSSLVDALHKALLLRETQSRRTTWQRLEPELARMPLEGHVGLDGVEPRPTELPRGPIEEYADRAWFVSLAGFGVSFATTRSVQRAVAAIYGGLPRPARLGRDVFCAQLSSVLARRDILVLDPEALRRLDRLDCLVLQGDLVSKESFRIASVLVEAPLDEGVVRERVERLFDPARPVEIQVDQEWMLGPWRRVDALVEGSLRERSLEVARRGGLVLSLVRQGRVVAAVEVEIVSRTGVEELISVAHRMQMRVVVATDDESVLQSLGADDIIPGSPAGLRKGLRRLQREGRAVCFIGTGTSLGLPIADCGIGLAREGEPTPWGAHLLCRDDLGDTRYLLEAVGEARAVSKQSVNVALGAAAFGALVSVGGLLPLTTRRVLTVVNVATLIAMANGARGSNALERRALPRPRDPTPWHALDVDGVLERLQSSRAGLTQDQARQRQTRESDQPSPLRELTDAISDELFNPLAPLLAAGAGLSAVVGSMADATMVGGVVALNAVVGGVQRFRTERKLRGLAETEARQASVERDGVRLTVDGTALVVGDLVSLSPGDVVPADCRILEATSLEIDASSLTGESLPVRKTADPSFQTEVADRSCMLYEGTTVAAGHCKAVVIATGEATEVRRGANAKPPPAEGGVEKRLRSLMALTAPVAFAAGVGVIGAGLLRGRRLEDLVGSGVSLAVASVPEGLPLLATAAQLAAAERLSRRNAFVRNTRAVEALGRVDVICFDKTGTVTEGRIALSCVSDGNVEHPVTALGEGQARVLAAALRASAQPGRTGASDPMDLALREAGQSVGIQPAHGAAGWSGTSEVSFEAGRSYHAVLGSTEGQALLSVKGAPEVILLRCSARRREGQWQPLDEETRLALVSEATRLARRGLRVLAVGERRLSADAQLSPDNVVDLAFVGFIGFADPVRPAAARAVDGLRRAGISCVMLTGDHPSTAQAIAVDLGLGAEHPVVTGAELASLSDASLDQLLRRANVFARVTPSQKVRLIRAMQRTGRVVAMVGDGANDAPAIRLADVGIAIGAHSTAAARGAADIVLVDSRIETLVDAVAEGRAMWASVRDAVSILMGGNLGEIGFTLGVGLLDGRPPLNARQLLLVNLLTDVAPAMAIAVRPPDAATLQTLVTQNLEHSLGQVLNRDIASRATITALGAGTAWAIGRFTGTSARARTIGLAALVGTQLGQTLTSGGYSTPVVLTSLGSLAALVGIVQTPGLSHLFGCRPLGPLGWATALGASAAATSLSTVVSGLIAGQRGPAADELADQQPLLAAG